MHLLRRAGIAVGDIDPGDVQGQFAHGDRAKSFSGEIRQQIGERGIQLQKSVRQSGQQDAVRPHRLGHAGNVENGVHGHGNTADPVRESPGSGEKIPVRIPGQHDGAVDEPLADEGIDRLQGVRHGGGR